MTTLIWLFICVLSLLNVVMVGLCGYSSYNCYKSQHSGLSLLFGLITFFAVANLITLIGNILYLLHLLC